MSQRDQPRQPRPSRDVPGLAAAAVTADDPVEAKGGGGEVGVTRTRIGGSFVSDMHQGEPIPGIAGISAAEADPVRGNPRRLPVGSTTVAADQVTARRGPPAALVWG